MIARLGQVLYWFACGLAALFAVGAIMTYVNHGSSDANGIASFMAVCAVLIWLAGRAILYVLAAR